MPQSTCPSTSMPSTSIELEVARRERQPPPLGRLAEDLDGWRQQPHDLVRLEPPLDVGRDAPEERVDAEAGRQRLERVERASTSTCDGMSPTSSSRLAERGREEVAVDRLRASRRGGRAGRRGCPGRSGGGAGSGARRRRPGRRARARRRRATRSPSSRLRCASRSATVSRRRISRASPSCDEHGCGPGDAVVVRRHRERVGAGGRDREEVAARSAGARRRR